MDKFWNLFRHDKSDTPQKKHEQKDTRDSKEQQKRHRNIRDFNLEDLEYIPLPPSPASWEVDGRDEWHNLYDNAHYKEIIHAGWDKKHSKTIKLCREIEDIEKEDEIAKIAARSFRAVIKKRTESNQIKAAAKFADEMLSSVPNYCSNADRKRFNALIKTLDQRKINHEYTQVLISKIDRQPLFEITFGEYWSLSNPIQLAPEERPNIDFKLGNVDSNSILQLDKSGKSKSSSTTKSILRRLYHRGELLSKVELNHEIYRLGVNSVGSGTAILDKDAILYLYDSKLNVVHKQDLTTNYQVKEHFKTTDTEYYWGDLKSQIRDVSVSSDGNFYSFALVDEHWCYSMANKEIWGVRMPPKKGWERVIARAGKYGLNSDIMKALSTLELSLPVSPQEIKKQYRKLALQYHPDRNPNHSSNEKMRTVIEAFKILTGVDPETLEHDGQDSIVTTFRKKDSSSTIDLGFTKVHIDIFGFGSGQDWIYTTTFASKNLGGYIGTESGKVYEFSSSGNATRVYDVGSTPSQIIDYDKHLYILTSTRLYIIEKPNKLVNFLDIFRQGKFYVTSKHTFLLDDKKLKIFTHSGNQILTIQSLHPIRSIFQSTNGATLETRQNQVTIEGFELF